MEGHGDHWNCFGGAEEAIKTLAPLAIADDGGDVFASRENLVRHPETGEMEPVFALANPGTDLRPLVVIAGNSRSAANEVWSAYPFARVGIRHRLVIEKIEVWENEVEARLATTFADGVPVGLFDTLYHLNRGVYQVGREYTFVIAGLAYSLEAITPAPIRITDPMAIEKHRQAMAAIGETLALTADGALEFRLDGAAILWPVEGWDIDEYEFQGRVREVSSFQLDRWTVHRFLVTLMIVDDQDFDIILYAPAPALTGPLPKVGGDIRGRLWLQGYLAD